MKSNYILLLLLFVTIFAIGLFVVIFKNNNFQKLIIGIDNQTAIIESSNGLQFGVNKTYYKDENGLDIQNQYLTIRGYVVKINKNNKQIYIETNKNKHTVIKTIIRDNIVWSIEGKLQNGELLDRLVEGSFITAACVDNLCQSIDAIDIE